MRKAGSEAGVHPPLPPPPLPHTPPLHRAHTALCNSARPEGFLAVQAHEWFKPISWVKLLKQQIPAPYIPPPFDPVKAGVRVCLNTRSPLPSPAELGCLCSGVSARVLA